MEGPLRLVSSAKAPRRFHLAKFRRAVGALSDARAEVHVDPGPTPPLRLAAGGEAFDGSREAIVGSYVLLRADGQGRVLSVLPVASWMTFKPEIKYETLTLEEVEREEMRRSRGQRLAGARAEGGKAKLRERLEEKMFKEEEEKGDEDGDDDEEKGGEVEEEDGREGLDMEDEELFDDDEKDEQEEDDEEAMSARKEAIRGSQAKLNDADDEEGGAEAKASSWGKGVREAMKGVSAYEKEVGSTWTRDDGDEQEEDDGDEEEEEWADHLRALLNKKDAEPPAEASEASPEAKEKVKLEDLGPGAKRKGTGVGPPDEAKRVKTEAPPPSLPTKKHTVAEKEVVELIHESPNMTIKQLIAKFKVFLTDAEVKAQFLSTVKEVARLETEGTEKVLVLREATLKKYGLS
mmetsp:Transcript_33857/g.77615  ORF Transcript_33857/g.77615 Transcript_33857/m.77615 type:complete len:405 (+) Transcript_33857:21-1235(+)